MQISPFLIYLWQLADDLKTSCGVATGIVFAASLGCWIASTFPFFEDESRKVAACRIWGRRLMLGAIIPGFIGVFVPTSKTIAMMVIIPSIANSDVIQKDVPELYNFAVEALKSQLKEAAK